MLKRLNIVFDPRVQKLCDENQVFKQSQQFASALCAPSNLMIICSADTSLSFGPLTSLMDVVSLEILREDASIRYAVGIAKKMAVVISVNDKYNLKVFIELFKKGKADRFGVVTLNINSDGLIIFVSSSVPAHPV